MFLIIKIDSFATWIMETEEQVLDFMSRKNRKIQDYVIIKKKEGVWLK